MLGSHDLDEIPEPGQIRVSSHECLFSNTIPSEGSLLKNPEIYHPLYPNLFVEEITSTIVLDSLCSLLVGSNCEKVHVGTMSYSTICEGKNHLTPLFHESHLVDSFASSRIEESYVLNN